MPTLPPGLDDFKRRAGDALARVDGLVTQEEKRLFWEPRPNRMRRLAGLLVAVGAVVTVLPVVGSMWGFWRAYRRILKPRHIPPDVYPLNPASRYGLTVGAGVALVVLVALAVAVPLGGALLGGLVQSAPRLAAWLALNGLLSLVAAFIFYWGLRREAMQVEEGDRFGSARFATRYDLERFRPTPEDHGGLVMGYDAAGFLAYQPEGHFLTVAGTRGGKGVNLIIPNLLTGSLGASWVVVDPKGENAAVTAHAMKNNGLNVVLLNPWNMLPDSFDGLASGTFNPLDLLTKGDTANLIDDADIIAEMIVPKANGGNEVSSYFNDRARSIVAGIILHIVTAPALASSRTLQTLWMLLRLPSAEFRKFAESMAANKLPATAGIVASVGNDLLRMMDKGEREFASQLSTLHRFTDFLKSPALGKNIATSSFDLNEITNGQTAIYLLIPAERLNTQAQWLRLVVTTLMRATIRKPRHRVCFLLDEAAALGYISEVETALGAYAGFGVSVWNVFQNLTQIETIYGRNWENVLSSSAVRHFFSVGDQFTADYLSRYAGSKTLLDLSPVGNTLRGVTARALMNPDEVRRATVGNMLLFVEAEQPALVPKSPYYEFQFMRDMAKPNPYYGKGSA